MERAKFEREGLALSVASTGNGPAFVFQHGLCGAASQPAEVFPADIGWQCLTLECRGHGQAEAGDPDAFSIKTFADDLAAFVTQLHSGPVVLGGISMGAAIALRLAVTRPDLVRGLVLARPAWVDQAAPDNMAPNAEVGRLLRDYPPEEAAARFADSPTALRLAQEAPENLASLRSFFSRQPISVTQALLLAISADGPGVSRDEISAINMPTLVIGHQLDAVHPLSMTKEFAVLIPGATLVEITPKAENLDRYRSGFAAALAGFLKAFPV
jgi:pimeloyl-ACP methyl ester carboxylesterase